MFRIAICDDENHFLEDMKVCISKCLMEKGLAFEIDTYDSGAVLLALGIELVKYTVVFLDINMKGLDGVTIAKKIRTISKEVFIVFVTAYVDYTLEGYKVNAIRYLVKGMSNFQDTVDECMDAVIERMNYTVVKKEFRFNEGEKEISLERLLYIESQLHKLEFHVMEDQMKVYTIYRTLNEVEEELEGNNFVRIHQSFLVNLKYIKDILRYKAILGNGIELIIPKARYKYVKDAFIAYQGEAFIAYQGEV